MTENEDKKTVNIQEIIPLVEKRPVIWDHHLELFKHKNATLEAWDEICSEYNKEYTTMPVAERKAYRTTVVRKWRNVKDSWRKHLVRRMRGETGHRRYLYDRELMFLKEGIKLNKYKVRKTPKTIQSDDESTTNSEIQIKDEILNIDDNMEDNALKEEMITNEYTYDSDIHSQSETESVGGKLEQNEFPTQRENLDNKATPSFTFSQSTRSNHDESETSHLISFKEQEDRHVSFIKGVLPSLRNFNESQVLTFQMGILQLIQSIKEKS
ncbi:uncharacterized protein LOC129910137 [Episyrphus balteatus]|uniref:uncharacterized protein LOC129910137 n=1 Tax=Episyrphus balteatus TaxID=286459 RepID=UPI0024852545|nr:uncharacterized protein LOC129910137 [Episyrphus balteatus]